MSSHFKVACVQTNAKADLAENMQEVSALVKGAALAGAKLILTPENVGSMSQGRDKIIANAWAQDDHPGIAAFAELARETGTYLMAGSLSILLPGKEERVANRSFLFDDSGAVVATYDKIHMFDVDLDTGESHRESATFRPGEKAVLAQTPWGKLGMTICYDLRFPYLFRALAKGGASFLAVPSAFTRPTGAAHWRVLLRARAIENGCYVFAPGQCGEHDGGRLTYGHSLIIDPWGNVLSEAGDDTGFIMAEIDPSRVGEVRSMVPSLTHDRDFDGP